MSQIPLNLDLQIYQGATFIKPVLWETLPYIFKPITAITQSAPVQITAAAHGLTDGWYAAVESVKGMLDINADSMPPRKSDYYPVTVVDANNIKLNDINSSGFMPYKSGGTLRFYTPQSLVGFSAKMEIKDVVGGTILWTLSSALGTITLDPIKNIITLNISATNTAAFTWTDGVYDLELTSGTGVVTALLSGAVTVTPEVTT